MPGRSTPARGRFTGAPRRALSAVIADEALLMMAQRRSGQVVDVLVEVEDERLAFEVALPGGSGAASDRTSSIGITFAPRGGEPMDAAAELARITGRSPRFLRVARAYALQASGSQLAEIAALPMVAAIRPNGRVRAVAG